MNYVCKERGETQEEGIGEDEKESPLIRVKGEEDNVNSERSHILMHSVFG